MKKYEEPELEIRLFVVEDIIAASGDDGWTGENGGNNTGWN